MYRANSSSALLLAAPPAGVPVPAGAPVPAAAGAAARPATSPPSRPKMAVRPSSKLFFLFIAALLHDGRPPRVHVSGRCRVRSPAGGLIVEQNITHGGHHRLC